MIIAMWVFMWEEWIRILIFSTTWETETLEHPSYSLVRMFFTTIYPQGVVLPNALIYKGFMKNCTYHVFDIRRKSVNDNPFGWQYAFAFFNNCDYTFMVGVTETGIHVRYPNGSLWAELLWMLIVCHRNLKWLNAFSMYKLE